MNNFGIVKNKMLYKNTVLEVVNLTKKFILPSGQEIFACDKVSFSVNRGEIFSIIGENGAGKTTLMRLLYGEIHSDGGEIFYKNKKFKIKNCLDTIKNGIGMVHQHFMLFGELTVLENIIVGFEPKKNGIIDKKSAIKKINEISVKTGLKVNLHEKVKNLSVGLQQKVELLKILYRGCELLILDEPTALLSPQEVDSFFSVLLNLKSQGKTIIFVSHKLNEVMKISDRIMIMRQGKVVEITEKEKTTADKIAEKMFGKIEKSQIPKIKHSYNELLQLVNINSFAGHDKIFLRNINFSLHKGEILGFAGLEGNGQRELFEVLVGLRKPDSGKIIFEADEITLTNINQRLKLGFGFIPEDRIQEALILNFSLNKNLILGKQKEFTKLFGNFDSNKISEFANYLVHTFKIEPPYHFQPAGYFSGGNQQKAIFGREFHKSRKIFICIHPTRGLDLISTKFIHHKILELKKNNVGIIFFSNDMEEILSLSDNIAVIYNGKIVSILPNFNISEKKLGLLMTGLS